MYGLQMMFLLLISIIITNILNYTNGEVIVRTCEPIRVETCIGIGYNETSMPNLVGHELQTDADFTLQTFQPLIQYGCSSQLHFFLCSAYVPLCTSKVSLPIGPCRSLCESVRTRCHPVLQGFGFPWPAALDCNRFPIENNQDHMCMEGPKEPGVDGNNNINNNGKNSINIVDNHNHLDGGDGGGGTIGDNHLSTSSTKFTLNNVLCENLINSRLYARLNRTGKCAPLCEADILFNKNEKNIAEIWVTSWSVTSLTTAILATICLIISDTKWDKIIMPIVTCHSLVAVGWAVRWLAGRNSTACGFDPQIPGVSILLIDGLSNAPCAVTFLLRYYFGMAANVWWGILCIKWHFTIRRARKDSLNNSPGGDKNKDTFSTLTQLAAWGLPAIQTISVLVARLVDADELLGSCYVGNQSYQALRTLVLLPLFCYWSFGTVNIFAGYIVHGQNIFSSKSIKSNTYNNNNNNNNNQNDNSNNNNQNNIINNLQGLGKFLFILWIPSTILLVAVVYEYTFRDVWLKASDSMNDTIRIKDATMWPFMLRAFMEILFCVLSSAWTFGPRFATFWRNKFGQQRYKQTPIKYPNTTTAYSTTSYQTVVCPQNSMVSISKNSSIHKQIHNNNNKNYLQHQQHHQHHHTRHQYNQQLSLINGGGGGGSDTLPGGLPITNGGHHHHHHHHVHRKSRPYKSSAHSIILNGNETTVV